MKSKSHTVKQYRPYFTHEALKSTIKSMEKDSSVDTAILMYLKKYESDISHNYRKENAVTQRELTPMQLLEEEEIKIVDIDPKKQARENVVSLYARWADEDNTLTAIEIAAVHDYRFREELMGKEEFRQYQLDMGTPEHWVSERKVDKVDKGV